MYSLLLLNGGVGKRVKAAGPKQFINIKGLPILVYSLIAADQEERITEIVMNYPEGYKEQVEDVVRRWAIKTPVILVEAGETRHDSVRKLLDVSTNDKIIIHEAARPLVTTADFSELIDSEKENVSFMLPISFTVAPVDPNKEQVTGYIERDKLRNVQLPQKFDKKDLQEAHEWALKNNEKFTEDATLVASFGRDVFYITGEDINFKITTPLDVQIATLLLEKNRPEE
ncbi:MAG: 2-C-methyl-D-erythritol 4-phosphate cytidylyltransferase [Candidatus Ancillula sp.]|jgi:2-C-methyl-D-erythritol 4-phosphate cytidylyltransferase|nr:2-C-methyl-D-erythritol 4-phosphate cytidylyltransferase [Candidatus Ancillula sp.]